MIFGYVSAYRYNIFYLTVIKRNEIKKKIGGDQNITIRDKGINLNNSFRKYNRCDNRRIIDRLAKSMIKD